MICPNLHRKVIFSDLQKGDCMGLWKGICKGEAMCNSSERGFAWKLFTIPTPRGLHWAVHRFPVKEFV